MIVNFVLNHVLIKFHKKTYIQNIQQEKNE